MIDLKKVWDAFCYGPHPDVDGEPMKALGNAINEYHQREPLVQEVIRLSKEHAYPTTSLYEAARKLAEFQP